MKAFYEGKGINTSCHRWGKELGRRFNAPEYLEQYGFKVYSQNDEDGIIAEIFSRVGRTNKVFVEFGVQDGLECNTHYLLHEDWKGIWIEGSEKSYKAIISKFSAVIQTGQLKVLNKFITRENINELLTENDLSGEIDLLSIDIDGNDYHVWEAIFSVNPRVVVIEYNAKFPPQCHWVMEYDKNYVWDGSDKQGASLKAFEELGKRKAYQLVGTNFNGVNAFFVRQDIAGDLFAFPPTAENLYNPMRRVCYSSGHPAKICLKGA
jgi:hypothetical protein